MVLYIIYVCCAYSLITFILFYKSNNMLLYSFKMVILLDGFDYINKGNYTVGTSKIINSTVGK